MSTTQKGEKVSVNDHGELTGFRSDFQYSLLAKVILFRLVQNRDIKIIITGRGKTTGTGKTTLAIILARWINDVSNQLFGTDTEWSASDYSFMNVWEYLKKYRDAERGDVLITDELEYMFDRRRSISHENTKGTQAWSILRYKNVITIGTAPGIVDLDKRIPEGADIWINVQKKGRANVYYLTFNDFEHEPIRKRLEIGNFKEAICWNEIEADDDYQYLKSAKESIGVPGVDDMGNELTRERLEKELQDMKRQATVMLLEMKEEGLIDMNQRQIGKWVGHVAGDDGYKQGMVSKIKREEGIGEFGDG